MVAPLVGAWIETKLEIHKSRHYLSHPSWVRGLKLEHVPKSSKQAPVAPLVGAWIETFSEGLPTEVFPVAPLVGAWIETSELPKCC